MIKDKLRNCGLYGEFTEELRAAFEFLKGRLPVYAEDGVVEIAGDEIYALLKKYPTRTEGGEAEAHRKYIDIHYCVKGSETICFSNIDYVTQMEEYDEKTDCAYFKGAEEKLILRPGEFAVFFPEDVHTTGMKAGTDSFIEKILVKVMV